MGTGCLSRNRAGFEFFLKGEAYRSLINEQQQNVVSWKSELGDLSFANDCLLAVLGSVLERDSVRERGDVSEKVSRQASIIAAMLQNIPIIEQALSAATYTAAATLIRQELEAVEALAALQDGKLKWKSHKVFKNLGLGILYGQFSNFAHFSDDGLVKAATGGSIHSFVPILNLQLTRVLLIGHLNALAGLTLFMGHLCQNTPEDALTEEERKHHILALSILTAEMGN